MSQTFKHTPGPWVTDFGEAFHIREKDGGRVAQLVFLAGRYGMKGRRDGNEVAANARLIAAAPELLEALELLLTVHGESGPVSKKALAAISKAKGEL